MRKFKFRVIIENEEVADGIIEIDQKVFDVANSDEWKSIFYTFNGDSEIASHIAWRMTIWNEDLDEIEGFLDLSKSYAKILEHATGYNDYEFESEEIV